MSVVAPLHIGDERLETGDIERLVMPLADYRYRYQAADQHAPAGSRPGQQPDPVVALAVASEARIGLKALAFPHSDRIRLTLVGQ